MLFEVAWPERKERDLSEAWADLGPGGVGDATGSGSLVWRVRSLEGAGSRREKFEVLSIHPQRLSGLLR